MDTGFSNIIDRISGILDFFDFSFIVSGLLTYGIILYTADSMISVNFLHCIYNHRTTKTNQKYPSVNL